MVGDLGLGFLLKLWEFVFGIVDDETAATPREGKSERAGPLQGGEMGRASFLENEMGRSIGMERKQKKNLF